MREIDNLKAALFDAASKTYASANITELGTNILGAETNRSGDTILRRDKLAHDTFIELMAATTAVRYVLSEEATRPLKIGDGPLDISIDPLDGSKASIDGVPPGTIVGAYLHNEGPPTFDGKQIVFSGLFVYSFFLSSLVAGSVVERSDYNALSKKWSSARVIQNMKDAETLHINCSNSHYWSEDIRDKVSKAFASGLNTRWYASFALSIFYMVNRAEGVFSYPADQRPGYDSGYLRLVYEAAPMAFLIQQLGGAAHDGQVGILQKTPKDLHERTPLFIGEAAATKRFQL